DRERGLYYPSRRYLVSTDFFEYLRWFHRKREVIGENSKVIMRKIRRCWMTVRSSSHSLLRVKSLDNPLLENAYRSRRPDRSFAKAFSLSKRIGNQAGRIAQEEHSQNLARHLTRTGSQWLRRVPHRPC